VRYILLDYLHVIQHVDMTVVVWVKFLLLVAATLVLCILGDVQCSRGMPAKCVSFWGFWVEMNLLHVH
jgi:hypothetical protein